MILRSQECTHISRCQISHQHEEFYPSPFHRYFLYSRKLPCSQLKKIVTKRIVAFFSLFVGALSLYHSIVLSFRCRQSCSLALRKVADQTNVWIRSSNGDFRISWPSRAKLVSARNKTNDWQIFSSIFGRQPAIFATVKIEQGIREKKAGVDFCLKFRILFLFYASCWFKKPKQR